MKKTCAIIIKKQIQAPIKYFMIKFIFYYSNFILHLQPHVRIISTNIYIYLEISRTENLSKSCPPKQCNCSASISNEQPEHHQESKKVSSLIENLQASLFEHSSGHRFLSRFSLKYLHQSKITKYISYLAQSYHDLKYTQT